MGNVQGEAKLSSPPRKASTASVANGCFCTPKLNWSGVADCVTVPRIRKAMSSRPRPMRTICVVESLRGGVGALISDMVLLYRET